VPLFVLKRRSPGKVVEHSGVLVVGNLLGLLSAKDLFQDRRPLGVIVHSTPPGGVQHEVVYELGPWRIERMMVDETGAMARLRWVLEHRPRYDAGFSNCEHLVSFVETGEAQSPQVRGITTVAVAAALLWGLGGSGGAGAGSKR